MLSPGIRLLAALLLIVQMMASAASAQGLMRCIHANGTSRIETLAQQRACAEELSGDHAPDHPDGSAGLRIDRAPQDGCVDVPVTTPNAAVPSSQAAQHLAGFQCLAVLPRILDGLHFARPIDMRQRGVIASETPRPAAVLEAIDAVVLVI